MNSPSTNISTPPRQPQTSSIHRPIVRRLGRRSIEILIFVNLLIILFLFEVKRLTGIATRVISQTTYHLLALLLLFSAITLGLLYDIIGYSNNHGINYNDLDYLFWKTKQTRFIKLSNDFQSLVYQTTLNQTRIDSDQFDYRHAENFTKYGNFESNEEDISFLSSPREADVVSSHFRKPHVRRLRWWKPAVPVDGDQNITGLIEVREDLSGDSENESLEVKFGDKLQQQSNDKGSERLPYQVADTSSTGETSLHQGDEPQRKRMALFKRSKLKLTSMNHHNQLDALSKHSNFILKNSKPLLKFGPEELYTETKREILDLNEELDS